MHINIDVLHNISHVILTGYVCSQLLSGSVLSTITSMCLDTESLCQNDVLYSMHVWDGLSYCLKMNTNYWELSVLSSVAWWQQSLATSKSPFIIHSDIQVTCMSNNKTPQGEVPLRLQAFLLCRSSAKQHSSLDHAQKLPQSCASLTEANQFYQHKTLGHQSRALKGWYKWNQDLTAAI